jgi:hypothetical protein
MPHGPSVRGRPHGEVRAREARAEDRQSPTSPGVSRHLTTQVLRDDLQQGGSDHRLELTGTDPAKTATLKIEQRRARFDDVVDHCFGVFRRISAAQVADLARRPNQASHLRDAPCCGSKRRRGRPRRRPLARGSPRSRCRRRGRRGPSPQGICRAGHSPKKKPRTLRTGAHSRMKFAQLNTKE